MEEIKLNGESKDITQDNIDKLKILFPEIITEGMIDFDMLKNILGTQINDSNERYNFTWSGKNQAINESLKKSQGTLIPYKKDSKNWNSTHNLYIEGDNLEVLKLLQESYYNKIKMIYIDPPYNTGSDFVYNDNYTDNLENYLRLSKQMEDDSNFKLSSNYETNGKYHSLWLNMIYPRLKLARNLLTDDGVMFISIDDNEINNLHKVCNEIFGEDNVDIMIWRKSGVGRDGKMKNTTTFRKDHEYIIVCFNNLHLLNKSFEKPDWENEYPNPDNDPRGPFKAGSISRKESASNPNHKNFYSVVSPSGKKFTRQFDVAKEEFLKLNEDNRIYWGRNGDSVPAIKIFQNEKREVTTSSLIIEKDDEINYTLINDSNCTTTKGSKELEELLNVEGLGSEMRPKPIALLNKFIEIGSNKDDIILDFFSGSATTAHSVLEMNDERATFRRFIMVQLPEKVPEKTNSYKAGYKNICEIGKERIRRAGDKILEKSDNKDLDLGFKVFKLDSSNLTKWNPDVDDLEGSLVSAADNIVEGRTSLDLVYEIMLKYGLELTLPVEEISKDIFSVAYGSLVVCLRDDVTSDVINEIFELVNGSAVSRVVFKDNGFKSDADKTNIKENLRVNGVDEFITI